MHGRGMKFLGNDQKFECLENLPKKGVKFLFLSFGLRLILVDVVLEQLGFDFAIESCL